MADTKGSVTWGVTWGKLAGDGTAVAESPRRIGVTVWVYPDTTPEEACSSLEDQFARARQRLTGAATESSS